MEIKITTELENEIDAMIGITKQLAKIKSEHPRCYNILIKQYLPENTWGKEFVPDKEDNVKVRLYAEIIRKKNEMTVKVERSVKK